MSNKIPYYVYDIRTAMVHPVFTVWEQKLVDQMIRLAFLPSDIEHAYVSRWRLHAYENEDAYKPASKKRK